MLSLRPVSTPPLNPLRKASRQGFPLYPKSCNFSSAEVWLRRKQQLCCSSDGDGEQGKEEEGGGGGWSVEAQVEKILGDEESKALIQDLNAAVDRVAKAKRDLESLEEQERRASIAESLDAAESLVEECQRSVFAAEVDVRNAEIALVKARAGSSIMDWEDDDTIDRDAERVESGKAAGVSAVVGTLAGLPFFVSAASSANSNGIELAVSAGVVFVSCAVFGLTYRYAVRRDLRNAQLKAGCTAAFALVRSLGQIDAVRLLEAFSQQDATQQLLQACILVLESIAVFGFAAVGLEYCFQQGFVSPFPSKQQ